MKKNPYDEIMTLFSLKIRSLMNFEYIYLHFFVIESLCSKKNILDSYNSMHFFLFQKYYNRIVFLVFGPHIILTFNKHIELAFFLLS
jgi:hypothetical protein